MKTIIVLHNESEYNDILRQAVAVIEAARSKAARAIVGSSNEMRYCFFKCVWNRKLKRASQFHFYGFYKQLLDIFLVRRNILSRIELNPYNEEVFFPDIDPKAVGLHRRGRALYVLLLCQGKEGINFSLPKTADNSHPCSLTLKKMR